MVTIVKTRDDKWWQAQISLIRATRIMSDANANAALGVLIREGIIKPADVDTYTWIIGYHWTPTEVYGQINGLGLDAIDAMPRAADLTRPVTFNPQYPNRRGDPATGIGNAWYEVTGDTAPVGSVDPTGMYEKFLGAAQPGPDPTYYADATSPGIKIWVQVKANASPVAPVSDTSPAPVSE